MNDELKSTAGIPSARTDKMKNPQPPGRVAKLRLLLADQDSATLRLLKEHFQEGDFAIHVVTNGVSALELCQNSDFDVVIAEMSLPRLSGAQLLSRLRARKDSPEVILMAAEAGVETAVDAMRQGAMDFLSKPLRVPLLVDAVRRAAEKRRWVIENTSSDIPRKDSEYATFANTRSSRMKEISQLVTRVAKSNSTILISGDSGVGKEIIARSIHRESLRCNSSFIDISCAAIPETLLESELFGYEKGSFTSADSAKPGLFELAHGGTLFLDEIGEIGAILQTKLLRVIETRSFFRVGGTKQITVDVRILAATNKDLKQAVEQGKFRKDLYYRLNTISIEVPPLKERADDIPSLVAEFVKEFDRTEQRRFSEAALEVMKQYPWPGNVRELRNVVERALLISPHMLIDPEDLPKDVQDYRPSAETPQPTENLLAGISLPEMEKRQIACVLERTRWHRGRAAELLAISPKTLYRKIKQYELDKSGLV